MERVRELAALHALVTHRPRNVTVPTAVAAVLNEGDPAQAWRSLHPDELVSSLDQHLPASRDEVMRWVAQRVDVVCVMDEAYPRGLRAVHDAPPFLFYRGDLSVVESGGMSVVGTRAVTATGAARARDAAEHLCEINAPVISGLATGVDTVAHEATLAAGGVPIGVIATSILGPYTPAPNRPLHDKVANAGVLVSQFPPGTTTHKGSFLQRNATMSGLGLATIIAEAGETSGTRGQARDAMRHGRPVILAEAVAQGTAWGRDLADGTRSNVYVAHNSEDLRVAIQRVHTLAHPRLDWLDAVLSP